MSRKYTKRIADKQIGQGVKVDCTALYIRVSTEKQASEGYGLDVQKTQLLAYCAGQGWHVCPDHVYIDAGISGKTDDRPAFQAMLRAAHAGEVTRVVSLKIDRIARDLKNLLELIDTLTGLDVGLVCVKEQFDTGTAQGRFMLQVLGAVGELERSMISERVDAGRREKASQGGYNGSYCPLGYSYNDGAFVIEADTASTVTAIFKNFVNGWGLSKIADDLNKRGAKTSKGGKWYAGTVRYILGNGFYAGLSQWGDVEMNGSQPALIERSLYEAAHARLLDLKPGVSAR